MSNTEDTVNQAVMGDLSAISAVARRLDEAATPQQLSEAVSNHMRFRDAAAAFQREYSDIWGDQRLQKAAIERDAALAQAFPDMKYEDRLTRVGVELRNWIRLKAEAMKPTDPTGKSATRARTSEDGTTGNREAIARMRSERRPARTVRQPLNDDEDIPAGEESASDLSRVIASMAKARGARAIFHGGYESDLPPDDE
jgi:hypothetical protein